MNDTSRQQLDLLIERGDMTELRNAVTSPQLKQSAFESALQQGSSAALTLLAEIGFRFNRGYGMWMMTPIAEANNPALLQALIGCCGKPGDIPAPVCGYLGWHNDLPSLKLVHSLGDALVKHSDFALVRAVKNASMETMNYLVDEIGVAVDVDHHRLLATQRMHPDARTLPWLVRRYLDSAKSMEAGFTTLKEAAPQYTGTPEFHDLFHQVVLEIRLTDRIKQEPATSSVPSLEGR